MNHFSDGEFPGSSESGELDGVLAFLQRDEKAAAELTLQEAVSLMSDLEKGAR
jgi:hypothetical protein